ncbi:MAG: PHP domain-containing protein [Tepidisphaerales bacterium]
MQTIDLHCHSTASDGTDAPAAVARLAKASGLSAWALTDHDTIGGVAEAAAESARLGIDFMPGIEVSAEYPQPGMLHILGYGIDSASPVLRGMTKALLEGRDNRNPRIIQRLRDLNVAITMEEVEREAGKDTNPGAVVGRPHIAAILVRKGYVSSIKNAFDKYLAPGGLAYFDKERLAPRKALEMIVESGGIPVLAHPVQLRCENDAQLETSLKNLIDMGLRGVEVIHSDHETSHVEKYTALAKKYRLLMTGGSDYHGMKKKDIQLGVANGRRVPRDFFDALVGSALRTTSA